MESSTLLSQCYYSPSAFLPHLNKTRTGFLHLQPQKQLPPSSSSSLQIKPKSFSITRRIVAINTYHGTYRGTYSPLVDTYRGTYSPIYVREWYISREESDFVEVADEDREKLWVKISMMRDRFGVVPGLAAIPVGNIKETETYLKMKKYCELVGIKLGENPLPDDSTEEQLVECVNKFRLDPCVHYILIPTPLPHHMDEQKILDALRFTTGAGGFPTLIECQNMQDQDDDDDLPGGIMKKCIQGLKRDKFDTNGKRVVAIRSTTIFNNTDWQLLERENITVSFVMDLEMENCHVIIKEADILLIFEGDGDYDIFQRMKKPEAVIYVIDRMPSSQVVRHVLFTTVDFAYRREIDQSKSRK